MEGRGGAPEREGLILAFQAAFLCQRSGTRPPGVNALYGPNLGLSGHSGAGGEPVHAAARVNATSLRTLPPTISAWQGIGLRRLLGITVQPREGRNCYAKALWSHLRNCYGPTVGRCTVMPEKNNK